MIRKFLLPTFLLATQILAQPTLKPIATGFEKPLWIGPLPGQPEKLVILEQKGLASVIDRKSGEKSPFFDLTARTIIKNNEQGLLGLAFAPDYQTSGNLYLNLTNLQGTTEILRVPGTPGQPNLTKATTILSIKQPYGNHNGGWIEFGPDGLLYIGTGDGGAANDPGNTAQDPDNLLGKILRLKVTGEKTYTIPEGNPFGTEVFMTGLRNPWRCSFDPQTGDLWIADVGQNLWEEINHIPANSGAGLNLGWRLREASVATPKEDIAGPPPPNNHDPIYQYTHGSGELEGLSVTGGHLYRGPIKALQGHYLFADYQLPRLWSFRPSSSGPADFQTWNDLLASATPPVTLITTFGLDADQNLYLADRATGTIYRLTEK